MQIDGVFSGGGIKGFALIGAYQVLEERGYSFVRTAGTSAGSIIAAFITAGYTGKEIEKIMSDAEMDAFLDSRFILKIPLFRWLLLYWKMGLFKGDFLEYWINDKLAKKGISTFGDLPKNSLRIVASDITNGKLLVIPDDLPNYGINPSTFSIAKAVRMSCSIPYFFEPVKLRTPSNENLVVDGGVLSNFPMWLFDKENVKKVRPVIGIKLSGADHERPTKEIDNAFEMFGALFETMKDAHDSRYISRKHEKNIIFIPIKGIIGIELHMSDEKKNLLIQQGRQNAEAFLRKWAY
ncbi:patatin-like phospholipase family protein [Peribacillus alkalitolerans]|uniref:patatin-like phospholipase family protein n=1 Tax=Peribacillus alkalitolerans TaxID=1550385 RepID=UPI0013D55E82|nr:patatin-like phospholipase family protein [Peribacillus alkalitolerans]